MYEVTDKGAIKEKQRKLKELGLYSGIVDGIWGPLSQAAWEKSQGDKVVYPDFDTTRIIWATKVSKEFVLKVRDIAKRLQMPTEGANWLMACMAFETGETFSPTIKNGAGSGATGLIQFMPKTAIGLGTTTAEEHVRLSLINDFFFD